MTTGSIVAIGASVTITGIALFYALSKGNAAALAQSQATAAAAARAASNNSTFDIGRSLADLGGRLLADGAQFLSGGFSGAGAASDAKAAVLV